MTNRPSRFAKVKEIFDRAVELPPTERAEFVNQACGADADLMAEVRELLGHDVANTTAALPDMGRIRREVAAQNARQRDLIGQRIGPYQIQEQIGQGGMGSVYLAVRTTDFESRVAIKVTRSEIASDAILKRFHDEMRFQASLGKHPNIAAMLDAGETESGLPYFVMEYVDGLRIDRYCDSNRLSTRERIKLIRRVCSAVQFAHQNAVLHRDLKPSNILVTPGGIPVLIDFGIAKTPADGTGDTSQTQTAFPVFTPDYASPEQVRNEPLTTASDVYSLGVVCYELLTGHRPYHVDSHLPHRLAQVIDHQTPARPSDVVAQTATVESSDGTTQKITPDTISHHRSAPITRLRKILRGDLDTIVLMTLRKEPDRRYATADQLSADLGRYLDGLPVLARRDTTAYRTKKFVLRNKVAVALSAIVLLSLIGGIVGTGLGMADARHQRDDAELSFSRALDSVDRMLVRVGNDDLVDVPQMAHVRRQILEDALEFYQGFIEQRSDDTRVTSQLARAHVLVGGIYEKLYRYDDAMASYQAGIDLINNLVDSGAAELKDHEKLSDAYFAQGVVLTSQKQFEAAKKAYQQSIAVSEATRKRYPDDADLINQETKFRFMLAQVVSELDPTSGEALYREALEIQEALVAKHPAVIQFRDTLALVYADLGHWLRKKPASSSQDEAEELQLKALEIRKQVAAAFPQERRARSKLVSSYNQLGRVYQEAHRYQESIEMYQAGIKIQQQLGKEFPGYPHQRSKLSDLYGNVGVTLASHGRLADAKSSFEQAIIIQRELLADHPDVPEHYEDLGASLRSLAHVNNQLSNADAADALFAEELEIAQYLVENFPEDKSYREKLVWSLSKLGQRQERDNQPAAAADTFERALTADSHSANAYFSRGQNFARKKSYDRAVEDFSKAIELDAKMPAYYVRRGEAYRSLHQYDQAIDDFSRAIKFMPEDAAIYRRRGSCYRDMKKFELALQDYARAIELKPNFATAYNSQGVTYKEMGQLDEAIVSYTKALKYAADDPVIWDNRASIYMKQRNWPEAISDYTEALNFRESKWFYEARAYAKRKLGQYDSAINDYTAALAEDAEMVDAVYGRGWTYAQIDDWDAAEQDYKQAVSLSENKPRYRQEQLLVWLAQENMERFHSACQELIGELIDNIDLEEKTPSSVFSKIVITAAAQPHPDTDWNSLIGLLVRRVEEYPDDAMARLALGAAKLCHGQKDQAIEILKETIADRTDTHDDVSAIAKSFLAQEALKSDANQLDWPLRVIIRCALRSTQPAKKP